MITDEDIQESQKYTAITPAYFAARRIAENAMKEFEANWFDKEIKKAVEKIEDQLREYVQSNMLSDAEMNIQGSIYRMVDDCIKYLLSGERWAIEKYVLSDRYDLIKVREAIANHVPKELQDIRLIELQEENRNLKEDLKRMRTR